MIGAGYTDRTLTDAQIGEIVAQAADALFRKKADGFVERRVLAIVPDSTRTCPLPMIARLLHRALGLATDFRRQASGFRNGEETSPPNPEARSPKPDACCPQLDFLIALGTHPPMSDQQIDKLFGVEPGRWKEVFGQSRVFNHRWKNSDALRHVGTLSEDDVAAISEGLFRLKVDVTVNKLVFEYDRVLIVGPVFPHEVVGFSGGNKYFFPGVCGQELLNFFHWLGAVITNPKIIGTKKTPVRATIDRAAAMLDVDKHALCLVVTGEGLAGLYFGRPEEAWSAAADLSAKVHVVYVDRPFDSILAAAPRMYDDIWTAGKCMYKMESVVADGGELIIYAPHVTEVSHTHGKIIDQVGYHTRDYFLAQWDRFKHLPWGVLAHSTHVRGIGRFEDGVEKCRIRVTLATGIAEARCRQLNLGYRDPATINTADWQGQPGRLYVPRAGEMLYKLKDAPQWQTFPSSRR